MIDKLKNMFARSKRVKVPTILQMEAVECGAASLAMILAGFGLWIPLEKLRQECGVNRDGSKASNIIKAARRLGCEAKGYKWNVDKLLDNKPFPMIIHRNFNHFVVLEGIKGDVAFPNDPAMGRRRVPPEEFRTSYTGIAMTFKPGENFKRAGHRYSIVRAIAAKLAQDKFAMIFVMLIGGAMIFPGLASPVFNQIFLDDILSGKHPDWMFNLCLAMGGTFVLIGILETMRALLLTRWQKKLTLADSSRHRHPRLHHRNFLPLAAVAIQRDVDADRREVQSDRSARLLHTSSAIDGHEHENSAGSGQRVRHGGQRFDDDRDDQGERQ